jgi:hypothetical protein
MSIQVSGGNRATHTLAAGRRLVVGVAAGGSFLVRRFVGAEQVESVTLQSGTHVFGEFLGPQDFVIAGLAGHASIDDVARSSALLPASLFAGSSGEFGVDLKAAAAHYGLHDACSKAEIRASVGDWCLIVGDGAPADFAAAVASTAVVASVGDNNDLTVTAVTAGIAGDSITVEIVQATDPDESLAVAVDGTAVTITLPSDALGDPVAATATEVKSAWDATAAALALATVAVEGTGAGTVAVAAETPLAGGADQVDGAGGGFAGAGSFYIDQGTPAVLINTGTLAEPAWTALAEAA